MTVIQRALNFLILPFVTRVLTPGDYGTVSVITATVSLGSLVFAAAVEPVYFRAVVKDDRPVVAAARRYLVWVLPAASIVVALVWAAIAAAMGASLLWPIAIVSAGLSSTAGVYGLAYARGADNMRLFLLLTTATILGSLSMKVLFLGWLLPGPEGWVLSDLINGLIGWVLVLGFVRGVGSSSIRETWSFLRSSMPLVPQRLALWGMVSMNRPLIALFVTSREVGVYSLAANLAGVSTLLLMEFNRGTHLEFARETFPAPSKITRGASQSMVIVSLFVPALVAAGVAVAAPLVIGPQFSDAVPLLAILIVSQVFYGLHLVPMNYVVMTAGRYRWSAVPPMIGSVALAGVTVLGGLVGSLPLAAASSAVGYVVVLVASLALGRFEGLRIDYRGCWPGAVQWGAAAVGLVLSLAALAVYPGWLAITGGAVSIAVLIALGLSVGVALVRRRETV